MSHRNKMLRVHCILPQNRYMLVVLLTIRNTACCISIAVFLILFDIPCIHSHSNFAQAPTKRCRVEDLTTSDHDTR